MGPQYSFLVGGCFMFFLVNIDFWHFCVIHLATINKVWQRVWHTEILKKSIFANLMPTINGIPATLCSLVTKNIKNTHPPKVNIEWARANYSKNFPSSFNIHFWWGGVLCFLADMDLKFTGIPLQVHIRFIKMYFEKIEILEIIGPSSLNIYFWWVGVLCFLLLQNWGAMA